MTDKLPLIVEPDLLAERLTDPGLLIVDVCQPALYRQMHVPGAVHVSPAELVRGVPPATGLMPEVTTLEALFSRLGLTADKHVIAYDDEGGGWAGRLLWTLQVLGHRNYSYLNGGIHAWHNEGLPVDNTVPRVRQSQFRSQVDFSERAELSEVLASLQDPATVIWDARSAEEYTGVRQSALRGGHIPGAVNLDWLFTMDRERNLRLLPAPQLQSLLASHGITPEKKVITHCQTHHRSGLTWLVSKSLGIPVKAYDGSWSEWGNRLDTPIEN